MNKITFLLILTCCFVSFAYSQDNDTLVMKKEATRNIYGVVKIKGTDIFLQRATVSVLGSKFKTVTDDDGSFMIPNIKGDIKISITAKNFIRSEAVISSDTDVVMFSLDLDPVIHSSFKLGGLGDIPMAMLSSTSNFIKFEKEKPVTPYTILNRIASTAGVVFSGGRLSIRQYGSFNSSGSIDAPPLWVIDGVVTGGLSRQEEIIELLDTIGSDNVATICILKNSEAAIYGMRNSAGVGAIIITTYAHLESKGLLDGSSRR